MVIQAIIGLGNEGREYQKTYHNVGSFGVSFLESDTSHQEEYPGLVYSFDLAGYMNMIGMRVQEFLKKRNFKPEEIVVVYDDSDLPIGEYKLVFGGGSAGHKGIESIIAHLHTKDFWRLRIGIRDSNETERKKAGEFVLRKWSKADEAEFKKALNGAWEEMKAKKLI